MRCQSKAESAVTILIGRSRWLSHPNFSNELKYTEDLDIFLPICPKYFTGLDWLCQDCFIDLWCTTRFHWGVVCLSANTFILKWLESGEPLKKLSALHCHVVFCCRCFTERRAVGLRWGAPHLICSERTCERGSTQPRLRARAGGQETKGGWCDVALQRAHDIQTGHQVKWEEERTGRKGCWWWSRARLCSRTLNRSVERKERQFQFVKSSGNNPDSVMDQRTEIHWPTQKQQNSIYQLMSSKNFHISLNAVWREQNETHSCKM